jgi:hypothetical protein
MRISGTREVGEGKGVTSRFRLMAETDANTVGLPNEGGAPPSRILRLREKRE